jgi:hypothetical protein
MGSELAPDIGHSLWGRHCTAGHGSFDDAKNVVTARGYIGNTIFWGPLAYASVSVPTPDDEYMLVQLLDEFCAVEQLKILQSRRIVNGRAVLDLTLRLDQNTFFTATTFTAPGWFELYALSHAPATAGNPYGID